MADGPVSTAEGRGFGPDAVVVALGAIALVFTAGFTTLRQPYTAALVAGAALGLCLSGGIIRRASAAAVAGILGGGASLWLFEPSRWEWLVARQPAFMLTDRPPDYIERFLAPLVRSGAVARPYGGLGGHALYLVIIVAVTALAAAGVAALVRAHPGPRVSAAVACLTLALLAAAFGWTLLRADAPFVSVLSHEPKDRSYGYDAQIYERTSWLMRSGGGYYESLVRAGAGDKRLIASRAVADGRFRGWALSPVVIRQPWTFYLWRAVGSALGVLALSALLCVGFLYAAYFTLRRFIGERALLVAVFTFPVLLTHTATHNLFFPDWWAGLAVLFGVLAAVRGRWATAGLLGLAAALFRETAALWLVALLVVAAVRAIRCREREWAMRTALFGGLLAVFGVAFAVHLRFASAIVAPEAAGSSRTVLSMLRVASAKPLTVRFAAPGSYLAFAYGFGLVPPFLMLFLQLPGLWYVLRGEPSRAAVAGYAGAWLVFSLTIGVTSAYWGQEYLPLAVLGTGLAVATADRALAAASAVVRRRRPAGDRGFAENGRVAEDRA